MTDFAPRIEKVLGDAQTELSRLHAFCFPDGPLAATEHVINGNYRRVGYLRSVVSSLDAALDAARDHDAVPPPEQMAREYADSTSEPEPPTDG